MGAEGWVTGEVLGVDDFAGAAGDDASDDGVALVGAVEDGLYLLDLLGGDDGDEADAHVEGAEHLVFGDVAEVLQVLEERGDFPGGEFDVGVEAAGRMRGRFSVMPPPVMWAMPRDETGGVPGVAGPRGELLDDAEVAAVGAHEGCAGLVLELVDVLLGAVAGDVSKRSLRASE